MFLVLGVYRSPWICRLMVFIKFGEKTQPLFLDIFFCHHSNTILSFRGSKYTFIGSLEILSQLTDTLIIFSLFLCFILNIFYCCVFKFTNLFLCNCYSVIHLIQYIFHLRYWSFHFYKFDLDLFYIFHVFTYNVQSLL